jgi:hypothetical protein
VLGSVVHVILMQQCVTYFWPPLSKNLRGAVAWVAFVVALAAVCIPLGREGKFGYDWLHRYCLMGSTSTLEKPKGGSSGGSPWGGPSCYLYSIRERGGGLFLFELLL